MDSPSETAQTESKPALPRTERRRHPRFACAGFAEAVVDEAEFLFRGEIRDLSEAGCYVRTRARLRLKPGQHVDLFFTIQNDQIKCEARIASFHAGKGVGLEFILMTDRAKKSISSLLRRFQEAQDELKERVS